MECKKALLHLHDRQEMLFMIVSFDIQFTELLFGGKRKPPITTGRNIVGFSAAHPARAVNFSLGKTTTISPRPCKDILFAADPAEDSLLSMNCALSLLAEVSAISFHMCFLLDSSSGLEEWSRKSLLQAAYLIGENVFVFYNTVYLLIFHVTGAVL